MKIYLESLGCDKNLVDSEIMMGLMDRNGYELTNDVDEADVAVVNTCCFIGDAKEESIGRIIAMGEKKKEGSLKGIIAAGCLAQRYADEIKKELPEVDAIIGTTSYDSIIPAIKTIEQGSGEDRFINSIDRLAGGEDARVVPAGEISSYIKIAEGCSKRCTYCVIPYVRGNYRSIKKEVIVEEAKRLAGQGTKELILVAQETTLYGTDIYGKKALPELIHELAAIEGIEWIRILYCYPEEITDEIIECIKNEKKVCHYIDMPIQHASDSILKRMGRRTDQKELRERIAQIRKEIPDIALRTTLMTGFPGETEEDYEDLYNFVNEIEFDRLGVFAYSREEGTRAAVMEGQVPEDVACARRDEIMELQQAVSIEKNEKRIGKTLKVMVEGSIPDDDTAGDSFPEIKRANKEGRIVYAARSYMDAPEIDGLVFFDSDRELMSGTFVDVKVTSASEYDLYAETIDF